VIQSLVYDGDLHLRIQNRTIPRWIDVELRGVTHEGRTVDLGRIGSLGPPESHLFLTGEDFAAVLEGRDSRDGSSFFPPIDRAPWVLDDVDRFREIRVRCFGFGLGDYESLSREDFPKALQAAIPTLVDELVDIVRNSVSAAKTPKRPELRGRPRKNATGEWARKAFRRMGKDEIQRLYEILTDEDIGKLEKLERFSRELSTSYLSRLVEVAQEELKLSRDALAQLGIPRRFLPSSKSFWKALRFQQLFDLGQGVYDLMRAGSLLFVDPLTVFTIELDRPAERATLLLLDTSGSMAENGKIEQARRSALAALEQARQQDSRLAVATFAGRCTPSSVSLRIGFEDLDAVEAVLRGGIPQPAGGTPLPQALEWADERLRHTARQERRQGVDPRFDLLLLSDGESTCGPIRPPGVYARTSPPTPTPRPRTDPTDRSAAHLRPTGRSGLRLLTVGFGLQPGSPAERDLQYLAATSGGRHLNAQSSRQLRRAFEKLVRTLVPKPVPLTADLPAASRAAFLEGAHAIRHHALSTAQGLFETFAELHPHEPAGHYNLALSLEGLERYLGAARHYRRYLNLAPDLDLDLPDREPVARRIRLLRQDLADRQAYLRAILRSDLVYLESYYQSLFHRRCDELAEEFAGFVRDKRQFYADLPAALETDALWLEQGTAELVQGLDTVAARLGSPNFDRDAVSLLTLPLSRLEELVERLEDEAATKAPEPTR